MLLLVNPDTYVRKLRKYLKCVWKDTTIAHYCKTLKISDSMRITPLFDLNIFLAISQKGEVAEGDYI